MDTSLGKLFFKEFSKCQYLFGMANGNGERVKILTAVTPSSRGVDGNPASDKDAMEGRPVAANCCATQFIPDTLN